jgi:hypothetical protein
MDQIAESAGVIGMRVLIPIHASLPSLVTQACPMEVMLDKLASMVY